MNNDIPLAEHSTNTPCVTTNALKRSASTHDLAVEVDQPQPKRRAIETRNQLAKSLDAKQNKPNASEPKSLDPGLRKRNRFYLHFKDQISPLLPENSSFYANLGQRMSSDRSSIVPRLEIIEQPLAIQGTMKDYQLQGLSHLWWLHQNFANGILGDEMGLGKTLQTLALFAMIRERQPLSTPRPYLVVCPLSVLSTWPEQASQWLPSFQVATFHPAGNRETAKQNLLHGTFDILVTTYESVKSDHRWLKQLCKWEYVVLDEGHRIRNADTESASTLLGFGAQHRLILSGTAVQNKLSEVWGLLHWLHPSVFTEATRGRFEKAFQLNLGLYDCDMIDSAKDLLQIIMLRRTKAEADLTVPPKEERTIFLPLSDLQRRCYYVLLKDMDIKLDLDSATSMDSVLRTVHELATRSFKEAPGRWKKLQNLLMQLRRVCVHPYILPELEPPEVGEHLVLASSKFCFVDKLLEEVLPKKERVILFSQFTDVLDMLVDFCRLRGIKYALLDGSKSRARRSLSIRLFQEEDSQYQVFLVSTKAGGQGITLTQANHIVLMDSSFNPFDDLQAIGRAHRLGQKRTVQVYRLICQESVEDQMLERLRKKLYLSIKLHEGQGPERPDEPKKPRENDLLSILLLGSAAVRNSTSGQQAPEAYTDFVKAPLDEIFANSKKTHVLRTKQLYQQIGRAVDGDVDRLVKAEEQRLLQGVTQVQTRLFEGQFHERSIDSETLARIGQQEQDDIRKQGKTLSSIRSPQDKHEHEDWCIACRGMYGGEANCCSHCPRIYHAGCVGDIPKPSSSRRGIQRNNTCPQHKCRECQSSAGEVGGMLYRCRTCPNAFCEACLPPRSEWQAVGDELPEFLILGYHATEGAFFIQCNECLEEFEKRPEVKRDWEQEWALAQAKLVRG
ncbi:SNF2 family N-terminal domain-containing protein [Auriculariales sp. MPI-PUGE-AT-0066]|nr:SNF2 family N-terminal domain-containing protein [Auriculariales sp. MPI-PUGE-AT-0066]